MLPFGGGISAASALAGVQASAWGGGRVRRLRRVGWAERRAGDRVDLLLGVTPRYVVASP